MLLLVRCGAVLDSRLWPADGGVRGRELEPEMFLFGSAEELRFAARSIQ